MEGVELGDGCEKTAHYASKKELVQNVPNVQGTQGQLEKNIIRYKDTKLGHSGQEGQEDSS